MRDYWFWTSQFFHEEGWDTTLYSNQPIRMLLTSLDNADMEKCSLQSKPGTATTVAL